MLTWLKDLLDGPSTDWRMRRRVTATAATVLALLWRARSGTSTSELVLLAALFLLTAGVWLHAQYVDDLDAQSWHLSPAIATALLVLSAVGAVVGGLAGIAFVIPVSVVVGYFGIASLMTWARGMTAQPGQTGFVPQARRRTIALAVGVLLAVGGLALVGYTDQVALGGITAGIGLALVAMPAFVLLAEWGIRYLTAHPLALVQKVAAAGVLLLVLMLVIGDLVGSGTAVVVVSLVAGLAFAAVLGTHVDFVAVMLVAALLGVTPQPLQSDREDLVLTSSQTAGAGGPLHGRVLVSLGDSYMSGEGASVFYDGTDTGKDQCRQAPTAWSRQLSQLGAFDSMLFLACSGALTQNLLHEGAAPPASPDLPTPPKAHPQKGTAYTQLDAATVKLKGASPDLVVVSVGGNDAGFSGIGSMCLAPGNCNDKHAIWDSPGNFAQLQNQLDQVYTEIGQQFPGSAVVVTPYPDPIDTDPDADCGDLLLTRSEVRFVHDFLLGNAAETGLDGTIEQTAKAHGFYYAAPMVTALHDEHLQLCDPTHGSPGIHFIGLRSIQGVAEQRFNPQNWLHSSLHPNEKGHAALLHAFSGWYQQQLGAQIKAGTAVASGDGYRLAARTTSTPLVRLPYDKVGCDIADRTHGCRADASTWVRGEAVDLLLKSPAGLLLAVAALAGAALAASLTAWRRQRWAGAYVPFP